MNIIILVVSVVGAFFIYKMAAAFVKKWMPQKLWAKPVYTLIGLGLGLAYINFAGYSIMDKEANPLISLFIALIPWVLYFTWKIITRAKMIEE